MSINIHFHKMHDVSISDAYPDTPGKSIAMVVVDASGNSVSIRLEDTTLRMLAIAMQRYAASREKPPVEPNPSYATTLFAPERSDEDLPF